MKTMKRGTTALLTGGAIALALGVATPAQGSGVEAILTNIPGDPTSEVPGVPGEHFRWPLVPFLTLYGSPVGWHWVFKGFTDNPSDALNDVIVAGSGRAASTIAKEGASAPGTGGLVYGFFDSDCGVNDSGDVAWGVRLLGGSTATDESIFLRQWDGTAGAVAREGDPALGLSDLPFPNDDELFGNSLNSAHVHFNGTVSFRADQIQNVHPDYDQALYRGSVPVAQSGSIIKKTLGKTFIDSFVALSGNTYSSSADGSEWIVEVDVAAGIPTEEAALVTGAIVLRDGDAVLGSTVQSISGIDMAGSGQWFVRGLLADDRAFAMMDGTVIAATGEPITPGASEHWGDSIRVATSNSAGDSIVIGSTDAGNPLRDHVAVLGDLSGKRVVVRKGDPVDLDGDGEFEKGVFVGDFDAADAFVTDDVNDDLIDDRELYFFAGLVNAAGADLGDGFMRVSVAACAGDFDSTGDVGFGDLTFLLLLWGPCPPPCPADLDMSGNVGFGDLTLLLIAWGPC